jgi:hypothetical protein
MVGFACLGVVQAEAVRMGVTPARFEFVAYEGDEVEGTLQFANGMDEALSVHLEGAEFRPEGEAGKIVVGEPSDEGRSLAGWIVPVGGEHVVPPQVAVAIPFSLAVPRNAAPGLYWGVLVARTSGTVHLSSVVFLTVRGEAREGMSLESFSAPSDPSETSTGFVVRLRNTGETLLKPEGVVIVRTVWGREALALSLPVENVLPGAVRRLEIPLVESLGLGSYGAMLEIRYGLERRVIRAEATFRVVPWRKVLVVFSVLAAGGAVWVFGRRRVVPGGRAASVEEAH